MIIPRNEVIEGHVLDVLRSLPDGSVDVVITSPPYWGLRDYGKENAVVWGGDILYKCMSCGVVLRINNVGQIMRVLWEESRLKTQQNRSVVQQDLCDSSSLEGRKVAHTEPSEQLGSDKHELERRDKAGERLYNEESSSKLQGAENVLRVCDGTPTNNGTGSRSLSPTDGVCSSQKRGENRQQVGEFGQPTLGKDYLSLLSQRFSDKIICPCGALHWVKTDCQHQWSKVGHIKYAGGTNSDLMQTHPRVKNTHFSVTDYGCEHCGAWKGQLGLEPHPQLFIEHLVQIFGEVRRMLKPTGSCWIVIGDTYYGGGGGHQYSPENQGLTAKAFRVNAQKEEQCGIDYAFRKKYKSNWLQSKQKLLIPERFAIAMQEDGWILRNTVIWHKINPMPSSVHDRLTNAYESVFFFTKSQKYYFDLDAIRKQYPAQSLERAKRKYSSNNKVYDGNYGSQSQADWAKKVNEGVVSGGNPGDVWSLTSEAFKGQHFATYPQKLVKRILRAVAPKQVCNACGKPREKILVSNNPSKQSQDGQNFDWSNTNQVTSNPQSSTSLHRNGGGVYSTAKEAGLSDCGCEKGFQRGLVLDPFCGSGTTLLVAHKMGLDWLGIDVNTKYCKMANNRLESHGKIRLDRYMESVQLK